MAKMEWHTTQRSAILLLAIFGTISSAFAQSTPVTTGYRDFNFGKTVIANTTAEKPESKLWWNDGYWWGSLWNPAVNKFRIYRFEKATQSWTDVGPDLDDRSQALADALWDGQKLYIASHIHSGGQQSGTTKPESSGRLYRYSYDATAKTYSLDAGFPVIVNNAQSETLVLDKDSNGKLWVTWTQAGKVYLNRTVGSDLAWGTPFTLPVQTSNMNSDDISALIAFDHKIGVMWSNQNDKKDYFAMHLDSKPDTDWEPQEIVLVDPSGGAVADDHLNLKMTTDGGGCLYCAAKTSLSSGTGLYLLKRTFSGVWSKYEIAKTSDQYTRAVVVLDDENRELYVIVNCDKITLGTIRMKKVSYDNLAFPAGVGDPFILSSSDNDINDPTVSKQNVNSSMGLLVLGSDEGSLNYMHNYVGLASSGQPTISSFTPASGAVGTVVTINGNNLNGVTSVNFNGTAATSFTIDANTQITTTVPAGATTGKIGVAKSAGTAVSANDFTMTAPAQYTLAVGSVGSGGMAFNPAGGVYNSGEVVTLTATPGTGFQFSGWSGDLTGSTNPATITMNANKNVTATFTALPPVQHTLTVNTAGSGSVSLNPTGGVYNDGTVVTLTPQSGAGFQFSGWSGDLTGSANPATITMNANKNVTATFTALPPVQHTLTVNTVGSGSVSLNPTGGVYNDGTVVTLTPQSGAGFQFSGWSGDLTGSASPNSITMNANKTITATFTSLAVGIVYEETRIGGASNTTTVTTFGNLTAGHGHLYLAAMSTRPKVSVLSVSGLGLNWTLVKSKCAGRNTTAIEVWMAQGTPTGDGAVTATFASAPSTAVIAVTRYSGVAASNSLGNVIAGNTNGLNANGACSGGTDGSSYSFNLTTTFPNAVVYSAVAIKDQTHTSGAGYTERAEIQQPSGTNTSGLAIEAKSVASATTVTVDGSFNGAVDWAMAALAIKPWAPQYTLTTSVGGSGNVSPSGGTYNSGELVTLTATPAAGYQFTGWSGDLSGSTNPATLAMAANKNVKANFGVIPSGGPIVHEETRTGGSANATTVVTSASLTGVKNHLYLAAISMRPKTSVQSVSGLGLSWTVVKSKCAGRNTTAIEVWMAQGTPTGNGAVTATLASAPSTAVIAVSRYSGVAASNPIGNTLAGNTNGVNANGICSGGVDGNSYSFNLTTTVAKAVVFSATAIKGQTHTPGTGYTEHAEIQQVSGTNASGVAVEDKFLSSAAAVAVNGSLSGAADWAMAALEIKPQTTMSKSSTTAENVTPASPTAFQLAQNDPNPFNSSTTIGFSVPVACNVTLEVYDATDQLVRTLVAGEMDPGDYSACWNGDDEFNHSVAAGAYSYKMTVEDEDGNSLFTATRQMTLQPSVFQLDPSYPNPFNPSTQIRFNLPQASHVTIKVYTLNGAEVKTLSDREYPAGLHTLTFHAQNLPSGTYFYVMQAGEVRQVRRLMLVK